MFMCIKTIHVYTYIRTHVTMLYYFLINLAKVCVVVIYSMVYSVTHTHAYTYTHTHMYTHTHTHTHTFD